MKTFNRMSLVIMVAGAMGIFGLWCYHCGVRKNIAGDTLTNSTIQCVITVGGNRTTKEVVEAGRYDLFLNVNINSKNFPMRTGAEEKVKLEFIDGRDFHTNPTGAEVLAEAKRRGLERPTYEDALCFGEQRLREFADGRWQAFLHDPVVLDGERRVISFWANSQHRELDLGYIGYKWSRDYRFWFVRR